LDQITQITIDVRSPSPLPRFPAPESPEPSPMPPQNRFRLYHLSQIEQPGTHSSHPDQQGPIARAQSTPRQCPPQCNIQLMAQKQILGLKPPPRLEQIAKRYRERVQDDRHHTG